MLKKSMPAFLASFLLLSAVSHTLSAQPVASKSDLSSIDSGTKETSLGALTADALRASASVDMAFIPSSALRPISLPSAGLKSEQIAGVPAATTAPANAYVTMRLKGKQILAALEISVGRLPQSFDGFLQFSGIHVIYDPTKPEGSRILSVTLASGSALSPDSQYTAATTQPLGIGGMGYFKAWNRADIDTTSDVSLASVVVSYAIAHQPLDCRPDGRLTSK
jgi:hypothetical protein